MIASEADHEDLPEQRLVCKAWSWATSRRFATMFQQTAFPFTKRGMIEMLATCQHPQFGPEIQTLVIIIDDKRKHAAVIHDTYRAALLALAGHGQQVRLGVRWWSRSGGDYGAFEQAAGRLPALLKKRILPAASVVGLDVKDLLLELPDAHSTQHPPLHVYNGWEKLMDLLYQLQGTHNFFGGRFNPDIYIRFHDPLKTSSAGSPRITFRRNPYKAEFCNLSNYHMEPFYLVTRIRNMQEIHLDNCHIPDVFFLSGRLQVITMDNVHVYNGLYCRGLPPIRQLYPGSAKKLLSNLTTIHPSLRQLKLKNIYEGDNLWLGDGSHAIDITGTTEITNVMQHLLNG